MKKECQQVLNVGDLSTSHGNAVWEVLAPHGESFQKGVRPSYRSGTITRSPLFDNLNNKEV